MKNRLFLAWIFVLFLGAMLAAAGCATSSSSSGDDDTSAPDDDASPVADDDASPADDDSVSPVLTHEVDETVTMPGLTSEARVALDSFAIPYIFAGSTHDMAMVLGYMEAEQRFFQIDFLRHTFEGRLCEYLGSLTLDNDVYYRTIFTSNDGQSVLDKIVAALDSPALQYLQGFADGVNFWLAAKRQQNPLQNWPVEYEYFLLKPNDVPDWDVRDTIAVARYQTWDLSETLDYELALTAFAETLPADVYNQVFPRAMATNTTVLPPTQAAAPGDIAPYVSALPRGYRGLERARDFVHRAGRLGRLSSNGKASNNWVVSPSINGGVGYLANDPHLSLTNPSIFMLGYLDDIELGKGQTRSWGALFPGTPAVVIGANKNLAWGETVAGYDVLDVYAEQLTLQDGQPKSVLFNGRQVNVIVSPQTYNLRGASPQTQNIYVVPQHGPILPDSIDGNTAMSFRWTGQDPTLEIETFFELREAASVQDGFTAIDNFKVGAQNFMLQDTGGNIGYFPNAVVPLRTWDLKAHRPWFVLPGDGTCEWSGFIPADQMPQAYNPSPGYLLSANNDINGSAQGDDPTDGKYYWYFSTDIGYRAQRIAQMLGALAAGGDDFTMDAMQTAQLDVRSNWAHDLLGMVLTAIGSDLTGLSADAQNMLTYWTDWDFDTWSGLATSDPQSGPASDAIQRRDAVAAMGFGQFETQLRVSLFGEELTNGGLTAFPYGYDEVLVATKTLLSTDPAAQRDAIVAALNQATATLAARTDFQYKPMSDWYWGRIHNLLLQHLAFGALGLNFMSLGPFAIPGGIHTVHVADYAGDLKDYVVEEGPSLRIIHEFKDGAITTHVHYPGGQLPVPGGPHQQDMLDLYLAQEYYEMPHDVDSVLAATKSMIAFVSP